MPETNDDLLYECTIRESPTSANKKTYVTVHRRSAIIRSAREEIGRTGESLEDFAGIEIVETDEDVWEHVRKLEGDELFQVALSYHRRDGATFDIEEI